MFVEVKNGEWFCFYFNKINNKDLFIDGTDLATPRVFKIHPNTTYVGRDAKAGVGKQYFYVNKSFRFLHSSNSGFWKFRSMGLELIVIIVRFIIRMVLLL
jgi:hypothetical protein